MQPDPSGDAARNAKAKLPLPQPVTAASGRPASVLPLKTANVRDHYRIGKKLGQGQFGTTYQCVGKADGAEYACKSIPKRKLLCREDYEDVYREIQIMHHLSEHPKTSSASAAPRRTRSSCTSSWSSASTSLEANSQLPARQAILATGRRNPMPVSCLAGKVAWLHNQTAQGFSGSGDTSGEAVFTVFSKIKSVRTCSILEAKFTRRGALLQGKVNELIDKFRNWQ